MKKTLAISLSLVFILLLVAPTEMCKKRSSLALAAEKAKAKTGTVSGEIAAVSENSVTIETKRAGKAETHMFVLNPSTKRPASLKVGDQASIRYREEAGQKVATSITVKTRKR